MIFIQLLRRLSSRLFLQDDDAEVVPTSVLLKRRVFNYIRKSVVHNLFWPRATNRFLKPFRGQTNATTQPMFDKCEHKFKKMTCAVNTKLA